jgi:hypothetical protein
MIVLLIYCLVRGYRRKVNRLVAYQKLQQDEIDQQTSEIETLNRGWLIDSAEIKMKRLIDSGAYGDVWYGMWGDRPVAVKMLREAIRQFDGLLCLH